MKAFGERNPLVLSAVGVGLTAAVIVGALNYDKIPFVNTSTQYSAYFAEAGGLIDGAPVQVFGYRVGQVNGVSLDDTGVLVTFKVDGDIELGDRTEVAIKTKSLLGAKILEVIPRGEESQKGPIPLSRTQSPYQLPDALGDLTSTISGLDTDQLSQSLSVLSETFKDTPDDVRAAVEGVGRFSEALTQRDGDLRNLLANANKITGVLAERSEQVVGLIAETNALLVQLQTQSAALDNVSGHISALVQQLKGLIDENRDSIGPALSKLNGALHIVDDHKEEIQVSIKRLNQYAMSLGESVSSGPFFKAYLANLLPGQFVQPFVDAAFSDLGVDPNTLLPSQLGDPEVGQPASPALPVPFPRTGQAGDPRMTIPDAITGNPGDRQCGPPGIPLPGPGCYPLREQGPQPAPGGPPPGPPADLQPAPSPVPVIAPAPGEAAPQPAIPSTGQP
ncbi:MCE family protein [Mycobacterium sp. SMC-8]|uniref:MCE family protein n=1 Tax=Mycobacterium sp. SMC-8 TaxID=2857060 RepID=UPI0021B49CC7|nr:MCE family protein [Mycobacterium sp. SMC-8]UXA11568.1 MCE family protein [Mycobacterium sp. SMC-8]